MFKTFQGVTEDAKNELYLRPETAQGIFVNFLPTYNVQLGKRFPLAFAKSENHSVMKLPRVTLHSVPVNSNRWNLSFSANRIQTSNGLNTGVVSAATG